MIIAITMNTTREFEEVPTTSQNTAYCNYVKKAGMTPVLVPPQTPAYEVIKFADGLLLPGGKDIDPMRYSYSNCASYGVDPNKDEYEAQLLHAFRKAGKPVFGICRGHQLIFQEYLQSLYGTAAAKYLDYLPDIKGHAQTSELRVRRLFPTHNVQAAVEPLFNMGCREKIQMIPVNSMHHQACIFNYGRLKIDSGDKSATSDPIDWVTAPIGNLLITAISMRSVTKTKSVAGHYAIIEAMRIDNWSDGSHIMSVQWHPEELEMTALISNFFSKYARCQKAAGNTSANVA